MSSCKSIIALDIGGTKIRFGRVRSDLTEDCQTIQFTHKEDPVRVLQLIIDCIEAIKVADCQAIAIGVPCIVDTVQGVLFDAVNVPAWQEYPLKEKLEAHFDLPVYINNDVNCFIAGEMMYGETTRGHQHAVGICLGTGFGAGFFVSGQLHMGSNCCTGEVGSINYKDGTIDDYCSGSYFLSNYGKTGAEIARLALNGDSEAVQIYQQFGQHLANALSYIVLVMDPEVIIIGGSVSHSFPLFIDAVWQELNELAYEKVISKLKIVPGEVNDAALLGAAGLCIKELSLTQVTGSKTCPAL